MKLSQSFQVTHHINQILSWGITEDTQPEQVRLLRFTNGFLLLLLVASIPETLLCLATGAIQAGILNSTAILVFGTGLALMRLGRTYAARFVILTAGTAGTYVMCTVLGPETLTQLLLLFTFTASLLLFPLREWGYVVFGAALTSFSILALELTDYHPVVGARATLGAGQVRVMRAMTMVTFWTFLLSLYFYCIRVYRRSQETLVTSTKLAALGEMAAGIAHEVNNPLTHVVGNAEKLEALAELGPVSAEEARRIAQRITSVSMRIASVVHGLQSFARDSSSDSIEIARVKEIVSSTLDFCRGRFLSSKVDLRVREIPEDWIVAVRETQISQVLLNLLSNALDATSQLNERWAELDVRQSADYLELVVTDSGRGIPLAYRHRIFDPFFTTKPVGKGTGLGLSISRTIVRQHGGQLAYDADSPHTRFVVRLPRASEEPPAVKSP